MQSTNSQEVKILKKAYPRLARYMKERKVSYRMLGEALGGLTPQNIARRLEGRTKWTLHEVIGVCAYFRITDVSEIVRLFSLENIYNGVRLEHTTHSTNSQEDNE